MDSQEEVNRSTLDALAVQKQVYQQIADNNYSYEELMQATENDYSKQKQDSSQSQLSKFLLSHTI